MNQNTIALGEKSSHGSSGVEAVSNSIGVYRNKNLNPSEHAGRTERTKGFRVARRLQGFFSERAGDKCVVFFIVDGRKVRYELPAKPLKDAGVDTEGQPFEMDEIVPIARNVAGKLYEFRALARKEDAQIEIIELADEYKKKVAEILKNCRNA